MVERVLSSSAVSCAFFFTTSFTGASFPEAVIAGAILV
jgi:hypothetical protein